MSNVNNISFSIRNPAKQKSGDASFAGEVEIAGEKVILLLIADGVSKASKDWLASKSVIDFVIEDLQKGQKQLPNALKRAIEAANRKICSGIENTYGMLTTLSVVLFQYGKEKLYWVNIGDSRIFGLKNNDWLQLSTDDSTSIPYKENGKLKLQNGVPIMLSALTKAIGQDSALKVEIHEIPVNEYAALALASDGFYELSRFNLYATSLTNSADMEKEAKQIQSNIISEIHDDASLAVLRLPASLNFDLKAYLIESKGRANVRAGSLGNLETEIKQSVTNEDNQYLEILIKWMNIHKLVLAKPTMIELLELMIAHKNPLVHEMTLLIRKM